VAGGTVESRSSDQPKSPILSAPGQYLAVLIGHVLVKGPGGFGDARFPKIPTHYWSTADSYPLEGWVAEPVYTGRLDIVMGRP